MKAGSLFTKLGIVSTVFLLLLAFTFPAKPVEANIFSTAGKVIPSVMRSEAVKALSVRTVKATVLSAKNLSKVIVGAGRVCGAAAEKIFSIMERHPKATGIGLGFLYASRHEGVVKHVVSEVFRLPVEIMSSLVGGASKVLADGEGFPFKLFLIIAGLIIMVFIKVWIRDGRKDVSSWQEK